MGIAIGPNSAEVTRALSALPEERRAKAEMMVKEVRVLSEQIKTADPAQKETLYDMIKYLVFELYNATGINLVNWLLDLLFMLRLKKKSECSEGYGYPTWHFIAERIRRRNSRKLLHLPYIVAKFIGAEGLSAKRFEGYSLSIILRLLDQLGLLKKFMLRK